MIHWRPSLRFSATSFGEMARFTLHFIPAAILSSVAAAEIGKASGVFNMGRFLGGMFGIAALVAVFSGNGSVDSPEAFS